MHTSPKDIEVPAAEPPPSGQAKSGQGLALFAAALLLLILVGTLAQRFGAGPGRAAGATPWGIAITEVLAILLPALLFLAFRPAPAQARWFTFLPWLRPASSPSGAHALALASFFGKLVSGALLGLGLFYVLSVWIEPLLERYIPVPPEERLLLLRLLRPPTGLRPLWQDLLCFAAVPALCEEILFRGAILSSLGAPLLPDPTLRAKPAQTLKVALRPIFLCALLFGIFHLSRYKLVPTMLLGLGFGAAAVLSGSLWPAIAMHFTNNALVVLLVRAGLDEAPQLASALPWLAGALGLSLIGYLLLRLSSRFG